MMDNVETHFMTDTLDRSSQTTLAVSKDIIDEKQLQKKTGNLHNIAAENKISGLILCLSGTTAATRFITG